VLTSGALGPATALSAGIACAGLGCAAAAWLAATGAPAAAALGGLIALGAWSYSGPPLRLAASGWGEVDAVLVVAILVPLAGYAAFGGEPIGRAVAATVAPALATFAFMLSVEWPDRAADAASGKRNLLVRLGPRAAARLAALTALLVVPVLGLTIVYGAPRSLAVFALLLVPVVVGFVRCALARDPAPLEIAARGVSLIVLTLIYELLGYLSVLNPAQLPRPS
jgi:1,4-dihydroxy-2-naphthoate octaprenyltransferase